MPNENGSYNSDFKALFGEDEQQLRSENYDTPNLLLEQLAYVDHLMPGQSDHFSTLDTMINNEIERSLNQTDNNNFEDIDDRLALQLSIFTDDAFIFPDEEKKEFPIDNTDSRPAQTNNNSKNDNDEDDHNDKNINDRNNSIINHDPLGLDPYESMRAKFTSKHAQTQEDSLNDEDHGSFTNFEIEESNTTDLPYTLTARSSRYVSEPRTETVATNNSSVKIKLPDYSKIPTSTLVALLPKVTVPETAYHAMIKVGFQPSQIEALAAIIAYHEQEKIELENAKIREGLYTPLSMNENAKRSNSYTITDPKRTNQQNSTDSNLFLDFINKERISLGTPPSSHLGDIFNSTNFQSMSNVHKEAPSPNSISIPTKDEEVKDEEVEDESEEEEDVDLSLESDVDRDAEVVVDNEEDEVDPSSIIFRSNEDKSKTLLGSADTNFQYSIIDRYSKSKSTRSQSGTKSCDRRKLKEQKLETSLSELNNLAETLKRKITSLEMENNVLKDLVSKSGDVSLVSKKKFLHKE